MEGCALGSRMLETWVKDPGEGAGVLGFRNLFLSSPPPLGGGVGRVARVALKTSTRMAKLKRMNFFKLSACFRVKNLNF